jgi:hypothetical protein
MATRRSILKDPKQNKSKSHKNIRFSDQNHIRIIPTKEDIKKEETEGKHMENIRALLNQKINDMQYELENNHITEVKKLVKQVDHVLKRTKSGKWSGGKKRRTRRK